MKVVQVCLVVTDELFFRKHGYRKWALLQLSGKEVKASVVPDFQLKKKKISLACFQVESLTHSYNSVYFVFSNFNMYAYEGGWGKVCLFDF